MNVRRVRILVASTLSAGLLLPLFVTPVAAACALSAPASVDIGTILEIDGSGFASDAIVDVSIAIDGGTPDEFSVPADGNGAFVITFTPEAADMGVTTVIASTGADCTAEAVIGVGVGAPAEAPAPAETPASAEGSAGSGAGAPAPRTDGLEATASSGTSPSRPWLLAGVLFVIGLGGLFVTRPARSRP